MRFVLVLLFVLLTGMQSFSQGLSPAQIAYLNMLYNQLAPNALTNATGKVGPINLVSVSNHVISITFNTNVASYAQGQLASTALQTNALRVVSLSVPSNGVVSVVTNLDGTMELTLSDLGASGGGSMTGLVSSGNATVTNLGNGSWEVGTTNLITLGYWENTNGAYQLKTDWQLYVDNCWTTNGSGEIVLK